MELKLNIAIPLSLNKLFSYKLFYDKFDETLIGRRVLIELSNRKLIGIIVGIEQETLNSQYKEILEIIDNEPIITKELLDFTRWVSDYYFCSWGDVIKAALPPGFFSKIKKFIELNKNIPEQDLYSLMSKSQTKAKIIGKLLQHNSPIEITYFEKILSKSALTSNINELTKIGAIKLLKETFNFPEPKTASAIDLTKINYDKDKILKFYKRSPKQIKILTKLYELKDKQKFILLKDFIKQYNINYSTLKKFKEKGLINYIEIDINRSLNYSSQNYDLATKNELSLQLTDEQKMALNQINQVIKKNNFEVILLHGITGSGKTLIYLNAIQEVLAQNKTVLILVPEISLTPQLIARFELAFPGQISVLHSRMSIGERYDSWKSILNGHKKIVLGVRSALFSPLKSLGLIIVDEEHEQTYKQDSPSPRYQARDSAIIRAKIENAVIILGSATPSIESYYNAINGKYQLINIINRADNAQLPKITTVDMKEARQNNLIYGPLSIFLLDKIEDRLSKKEGVIIFINRRGFSSLKQCKDCGYVPECKHCSVSLTYHKIDNSLKCHYCGSSYPIPKICPECGSSEFSELGFGTQRVEIDIKDYFDKKNIAFTIKRIDQDTISKKGKLKKILSDFNQGKIDILVGTQIVAKSLDFPRVTLVGIINPDLQMFVPDFRAYERTFQLITQVSGRAGRTSDRPGEVIIQTSRPMSPAILPAIKSDYSMFYNKEIEIRKSANYPPFSRFCILEFYGKNDKIVQEQANYFRKILPKHIEYMEILGPSEPTIFKIRDRFRMIIIIKNFKDKDKSGKKMRNILEKAIKKFQKNGTKGVKINIDIDSYSTI